MVPVATDISQLNSRKNQAGWVKEYTERGGGKKLTSVCGYWERVLMAKEKLEKYSVRNEDKELLTRAWKEFNVSWQTMTLDPWEKANEARKRWLFWKLKIYRWWWNPRGCWKVLPKGYRRSKGGQFFPSVSFLGNYKLYILNTNVRRGHSWEQTTYLRTAGREQEHRVMEAEGEETRVCSSLVRHLTAEVSVHHPAVTTLTKRRNWLPASLQAGKCKTTASADSVSSEDPLPGSQMAVFSCVLWWREGARERAGPVTRPHSHDLITAQHAHTED